MALTTHPRSAEVKKRVKLYFYSPTGPLWYVLGWIYSAIETWWHTVTHGREVKGKLANAVGSQYSSRYLGTWCIHHYYRWCAQLGCQQSTELTPLRRFKWNRPFRRKTKSGFCACAITFKTHCTSFTSNFFMYQFAYLEFWDVKYTLFHLLALVRSATTRSPLTSQIQTVISSKWATKVENSVAKM